MQATVLQNENGIILNIINKNPNNKIQVPSFTPTTNKPSQTINPTKSPAPSYGLTTNSPSESGSIIQGPTTTITLGASGVDPIMSSDVCPAPNLAELVIDGTAYTAGPATITLFICATIDADFDPLKIKLVGFDKGLWLEMEYKLDRIELMIKSLDDYSQYWNRVRLTYVGDYPAQNSTSHFPEFSWDTVPRWISFRKNPNKGPFTQEEIDSIATNNYISWFGLGTPQSVIDMTQSIKDVNPKYKMLLYWNAESYWGSNITSFKEEWLKENVVGTGDRAIYDHSIPEMREWWIDHALQMDSESAIDGVFTDNTRTASGTDKSQMIKLLAERLPSGSLKLGNFLRQRDDDGNRWRMDYQEGSYFENQHVGPLNQPQHESIIVSMQLAREASWKRKVVMWNGSRRNCVCGTFAPSQIPDTCVGFMNVNEQPVEKLQKI